MSMLNRSFNILRGWDLDNASNYAEPLPIADGAKCPQGIIVEMGPTGGVIPANTPDLKTDKKKRVWLVESGNDDFDGAYIEQVNGIVRNVQAELDPPCFDPGATYAVDTDLTFVNGLFTPETKPGSDQIIAVVREVKPNGNIIVDYYGNVTPN